MAARVTITLPEDVLDRLDTIAREEGVARSEVVREAAAHYLTAHATRAEADARKHAVDDGIVWLEGLAMSGSAAPGVDSLAVLRELRGDEAAGTPLEHDGRRSERRR
ncbi:MAG: CopG family transcriptional regulator [Anaerosomatales bacterium]|nr:ribbon-helix-helix domain-containing protein [Coriobacteriia bacterium]MDF1542064.1 ribbon-helix-helix domain-containing protein [Anaerosomatales bacterium]MDT8433700.1 CopG family transcriptional regulator [Anaerosomatales bacterium]